MVDYLRRKIYASMRNADLLKLEKKVRIFTHVTVILLLVVDILINTYSDTNIESLYRIFCLVLLVVFNAIMPVADILDVCVYKLSYVLIVKYLKKKYCESLVSVNVDLVSNQFSGISHADAVLIVDELRAYAKNSKQKENEKSNGDYVSCSDMLERLFKLADMLRDLAIMRVLDKSRMDKILNTVKYIDRVRKFIFENPEYAYQIKEISGLQTVTFIKIISDLESLSDEEVIELSQFWDFLDSYTANIKTISDGMIQDFKDCLARELNEVSTAFGYDCDG